ncbi:MAG: HAD family hydrolase [Bacilli bacterium]
MSETKKFPKAIIFDLDGTLLDTLEDLTDAVNETLGYYQYPKRSIEEVRSFVGNGIDLLVKRALPINTEDSIYQKCLVYFKEYYQNHLLVKTKPYDGIPQLLSELKRLGIKMAIVSNKIQTGVSELNQLFFSDWVDVAIGDQPGLALKPSSDSVKKAITLLGLHRNDLIYYVGDSETDYLTAKNANLPFIGVTWGFRTIHQLQEVGAHFLIEEPSQLLRFILN